MHAEPRAIAAAPPAFPFSTAREARNEEFHVKAPEFYKNVRAWPLPEARHTGEPGAALVQTPRRARGSTPSGQASFSIPS